MYVSDNVKYKTRPDLCIANEYFESCFIEIEKNNQKNSIAGVIYRSHTPIDDFIHNIGPVLEKINKEKKSCYIMGDFNIDLLKDDMHRPTHDYLDLIYANSFIPSIFKPTRKTENTATIIDNILTNECKCIHSAILVTDISDHLPTIFSSNSGEKYKNDSNKYYFSRSYTDANIEYFKKRLSNVNWVDILDGNDPNQDYSSFVKTFSDLYNECIPMKKCKIKKKNNPQSPWITKGLLKSINIKNKLYKQYLKCPDKNRLQKFKTYRNKLNNLIRKSKREYYYNKFHSVRNNMQQTWKTINCIIGRGKSKKQQCKFKTENNDHITDPNIIASHFNNFFVNIGPKLASKIHHDGKHFYEYLTDPLSTSMYLAPVVEMDIIKIVNKFNPKKSPGHDDIGNFIVKRVINVIAEPLCTIFNLSLSTGIVPDDLKLAKVVPIYKKDAPDVFSNYRPVSVLPCFSKILERLVFNRCMAYIDKSNILNKKQFGFRPNHSTYMAIIDLVDKVCNAVEKSETTIGIFLDLSKAFDTIDHDILLYKLEYYGFRGIVYDWFKDYLNNRKQFVSYQSVKSDFSNIRCGVPQGSILGPLLFILYINDITATSSVLEFILFADDTTILYSNPKLENNIDVVNKELLEVNNWVKANKLSVNASKTNYMILGTQNATCKYADNVKIALDGMILDRVNKTKFLGLVIDENLTWKYQIDAISKTISRNIGVLNKLKYFVPDQILYTLYCTLVMPYVNYGILLWGNAANVYLEKIFKLQKWALRTISNSHYRCHSSPLFSKYNVMNVFDCYKLDLSIFMYKHYSSRLPCVFNNYFIKHTEIHNYHTRNAQDYSMPKTKKAFSQRSIRNTGPRQWNSLDQHLKLSKSVNHLRNQLKSKFISSYQVIIE